MERPAPVEDLAVTQIGQALEISFTPPRQAADGERLTKPLDIQIFRAAILPGQQAHDQLDGQDRWMVLGRDELARHTRGGKIVLTSPISEEDFNRWQGATLTISVRALTQGFRRRPVIGELSKPVETTLLKVSGPVEGFDIVTREKALELRWSPPQEIQGGRRPQYFSRYRVYQSKTGEPGSFRPVGETESTTYLDPEFEFNHTYYFKVRAVFKKDSHVAESADSQIRSITPRDTFPPQAPKSLSAIYTTRAVELIWTANSEADLAGYNVYRREGEGPPTHLNKELIRTPIFRDTEFEPGRKYSYSITAVDLAHNESPPSEEAPVETR